MANKIDSKTKRDRLKVRREPYWAKVRAGAYVGYRRSSSSDSGGTWIARFRGEDGKQHYRSLDLCEHLPPNEYDAAVAEANKWFDSVKAGAKPKAGTVDEAADDYLEDLQARKGDKAKADAEGRIRRYIRPDFGSIRVDKLTTPRLRKWLNDFVPAEGTVEQIRKAKASANRNLRTFKALLNHAHENGLAISSLAWDRVKAFEKKKVEVARKAFLSRDQLQNLIDQTSGGFRNLVITGALTGARYGELCALRVRDLEKSAGLLHITQGKTGARVVPLTVDMKRHFSELAKNKLPEAFLLSKDDGKPWGHSDQDELMRDAVKAAKLPRDVVFYTLRHSFIAFAVNSGMDIYSIAAITGTSVHMIEQHYAKLLKDRVRKAMARASIVTVA